jgi:hypothetical protein
MVKQADPDVLKHALSIFHSEKRWIPGGELAQRLGVRDTRELRRAVIAPLRLHYRIPIHSLPGSQGGYKLLVDPKEHVACIALVRQMGRDFMALGSVIRSESLDVVCGQMVMDFFPKTPASLFPDVAAKQDDLAALIDGAARRGRRITFIDVVGRLLDVLRENPQVYADDIDRLRKQYGGMLISADQRKELAAHADAIRQIVG